MSHQLFTYLSTLTTFQTKNPFLNKIMQKLSFSLYTSFFNILELKTKKGIIIIDEFTNVTANNIAFIITVVCFDYQVIIFLHSESISKLFPFFNKNKESSIYCISESLHKKIQQFKEANQYKVHFSEKNDQLFIQKEIPSFLEKVELDFSIFYVNYFWSIVGRSIVGFLIKVGYQNAKLDRILYHENFFNTEVSENEIKDDEFIILQYFAKGSSSYLNLAYLIEKETVCLMKTFYKNEDKKKLLNREHNNYLNIHHPLFPRYFGIANFNYQKCLLIEYLEGKTLNQIDLRSISKCGILKIIFEVMLAIGYLHLNGYIYRDLKPNNIIIDSNNSAFLIDFDRMVKNEDSQDEITQDFEPTYFAPEILDGKHYSNKVDIYSLGKIMKELIPQSNFFDNENEFIEYQIMYEKCMNINADERPQLQELIYYFYINFFSKNDEMLQQDKSMLKRLDIFNQYIFLIAENQNRNSQFNLGLFYNEGVVIWKDNESNKIKYSLKSQYKGTGLKLYEIQQDITKAIHYYKLAAAQNDTISQYNLAVIYNDGKYIEKNINKTIYYFILAAKQNNSNAQFCLGTIYIIGGDNIDQNINKGIYYLTCSAKQGNSDAQLYLGMIFIKGKYVPQDIDKAFHYLTLSANQDNSDAQYYIGKIYIEGQYVYRDIDRAIHYLTLAANHNHSKAQQQLGIIYYFGEFVKQDIKKAIFYFTLASNQGNSNTQFWLGIIYHQSFYVTRDMNKAIHYLSSAADQNNIKAQHLLGIMYYNGKDIKQDINKAIHYITLAADGNHSGAQLNIGCIYYEGKYITRDINKAIHYLSLAAEQNEKKAQELLFVIYFTDEYIPRDIKKAIYYLSLLAKQNNPIAQYYLGKFYLEGKYIDRDSTRAIYYLTLASDQNCVDAQVELGLFYRLYKQDINKAIHYFTLASNQNCATAQSNLGIIYNEGKYDIKKAIHYFTLAANQNEPISLHNLGIIYLRGIGVEPNAEKSIHYLTLSSNQNFGPSQFLLGIHYLGSSSLTDIKKGIYLFRLSSMNGFKPAHFALGYLNHDGKYMKKDINKAIRLYKEASSFNYPFAKNNLGILYKNGYGKVVSKNLGLAIEYFKEAIRQKNDILSKYNLAHLYLYEMPDKNSIDKSIELLFSIVNKKLGISIALLCIALIVKHGFNLEAIKIESEKNDSQKIGLAKQICDFIEMYNFINQENFNKYYEYMKNIDFLYNVFLVPINSQIFQLKNHLENDKKAQNEIPNISDLFYEGFGIDTRKE